MGKARKSASSASRTASISTEAWWRFALHGTIFLIFASGIVSLFRFSQIYVDRRIAFPTEPPKVVLVNRPVWMTDFLADQIIRSIQPVGLHSTFDRQLLVATARSLGGNPWVQSVNEVRRVYGDGPGDTLQIDCVYRAPAAVVKWGQYFWMVDSHGVKLPEQYTADQLPKILVGPDGRANIRIIDGVSRPPCEPGGIWPGGDVAAALEMTRVLSTVDWADQIRVIDVSNFSGRRDLREAQIVLVTRFGTQVRWGRPPSAPDAFVEVPPAQKLAAIEYVYRHNQRVDANQPWIDVRLDRVTCPDQGQNATAQVDNASNTQ